ncbi:hypothetical protein Tco_1050492 [Tanacetum coccineum]
MRNPKLLETDLDWHYAVEYSKVRSYRVRLNLKSDDPHIICYMKAYDQEFVYESDDEPYDQEFVYESDDEPYDENAFCCNEEMTASHKDASALRVVNLG